MKVLFLIARVRRSASTLEPELRKLADGFGTDFDATMSVGDLFFCPIEAPIDVGSFHRRQRKTMASDLFVDWLLFEVGQEGLHFASDSDLDEFDYYYGRDDDVTEEIEDDWLPPRCTSDGLKNWLHRPRFENSGRNVYGMIGEAPPSFGQRLMIVIGLDRDRSFLQSPMGRKLLESIRGKNIFASQSENAAVIAFNCSGDPQRFFEQIARRVPPNDVEDVVILSVGRDFIVPDEALSFYAAWRQSDVKAISPAFFPAKAGQQVKVERIVRRGPKKPQDSESKKSDTLSPGSILQRRTIQ
jgi:hypothetical protein